MSFIDLKVGDRVIRLLGGAVPMLMEVCHVDDRLLYCREANDRLLPVMTPELIRHWPGWKFDRATGVEEDEDLGWGVEHKHTGSYLVEAV